jgi:hypothetical protein
MVKALSLTFKTFFDLKSNKVLKVVKKRLFKPFIDFLIYNYSDYNCMRRHILIDNTIKIIFNYSDFI